MEIHDLKRILSLVFLPIFSFAAVPDGYVVKVDASALYLDWGKSSGAQPGDTFKIYRLGEPLKHPVTGEVLGQTEVDLGEGTVERLEEKYSTGKILGTPGAVKAGDRTRHLATDVAAPAAVVPAAAVVAAAIRPTELWRGEPLPYEATGLALGNVVGDGKKQIVVASHNQIELFQWNGTKLESLAVYKGHGNSNYLAVDTADLDGAGHDKIFASLFIDGIRRARTIVLDYSQGALQEVGHVEGFVRAFDHADGKRELLWQNPSMSREFRVRPPALLRKDGKRYREGDALKLARALNNDQLFGYTWGDWDGDGAEDMAVLQSGERLRIFFKDAKWGSKEVYGGTKSDFSWENEEMGSLYPRLLTWKPTQGKMQLIVPHNISISPIRLARLKIFKEAEIIDLQWNGLEMAPLWTLPIAGTLADLGIGDGLQKGTPQLWTAAVGPGDKSLLIAYQIP